MKTETSRAAAGSSDSDADTTGLPWPRSWKGVYLFVFASFCLWLGLLVFLTLLYS